MSLTDITVSEDDTSVYNSLSLPLEYNKVNYLDITNQLNNYNEIYNMNKYAESVNQIEYDHISTLDANLKTKLYKLKQEYFLVDYANHNMVFWTNVLYFSVCFTCLTLITIAVFNSSFLVEILKDNESLKGKKDILFYVVIAVLATIYLVVIMVVLAKKVMRRKYAWDQYYYKKNISS
jgi:hypothetical protein